MGSKPLHVKLREKRNRPPEGAPWIWLTKELLESGAWRTASVWTRRFVERLMIEHMDHAGTENGNLICTYDDCVKWGILRRRVKDAQTEAIRRGLVYRTQKGIRAAGRGRRPSRFGLGWLGGHDGSPPPNRWKAWHPPKQRPRAAPLPAGDIKSSSQGGTGEKGGNASSATN